MFETQFAGFILGKLDIVQTEAVRDCVFVIPKLRANVFEASQRLDAAQPVMLSDRFLQIGCDKRFDNDSAGRVLFVKDAFLEESSGSIPRKEGADLISCQ